MKNHHSTATITILLSIITNIAFLRRPFAASTGIPLGILIDKSWAPDIKELTDETIKFINNDIKYGRNKWAYQISSLNLADSNQLIRAICHQMSRGVLSIFGATTTTSAATLKSLVNSHKMPFFTWSHPYKYKLNEIDERDVHDNEPDVDHDTLGSSKSSSAAANNHHHQYHHSSQNSNEIYFNELGGELKTLKDLRRYNEMRSQPKNFQIHMHPDMVPMLTSLIKYNRWQTIYYVYNHEEALTRLEGLFEFQMNETDFVTSILVRKIDDINGVLAMLKNIEEATSKADKKSSAKTPSPQITMMVDLDTKENYMKFLDQIRQIETNKIKYHYLLVTLGIFELNLQDYRHNGLNITGFSMVDYKNVHTLSIFNKLMKIHTSGRIKYISNTAALIIDSLDLFNQQINPKIGKDVKKLFDIEGISQNRSEIFINSKKGCDCSYEKGQIEPWILGPLILNNILNMQPYEGLTGVISFDENGYRANYTIDIYRAALNMPMAKIGSYSSNNGLRILEEAIFRERDGLMSIDRNRKRIIVSIRDDPFFMIKTPPPGKNYTGNDQYEGYCVDLAEKISQILNFTYEFRQVKDNKFGAKDANGNWNGIIGELVRHEADLAVAGLTISLQREQAVEFSMPFMNIGISIMVTRPQKEQPKVFSFMAPLSKEIWMCIVLAYVGISVILFLVSRFSPYEWHLVRDMGQTRLHNDFTIFNTLWFCLAAFMQQGVDIAPRSVSGRLVTSAWWFFTLILISSYTANLAAFLTVERMVAPIESAEDLVKQTEIQYGAVEGGSTKEFFRTSKIQTYQRMWSFMNGFGSSVFVKNNFDGVKKVRESKGKYAFLLESSVNEYLNERKPCDTMKVGNNLDSKGYGIATPLGSDLKEPINLAILQLREEGYLEELKKKWWFERSECEKFPNQAKDTSRSALKFGNIAGIFYILMIGLVISVVIAAFEVLYKAKVEAKRSKMIFKEAVKSKVRLSITGYEDSISLNENKEIKNAYLNSSNNMNNMNYPPHPHASNYLSAGPLAGQTATTNFSNAYGWNLEPPKRDSLI